MGITVEEEKTKSWRKEKRATGKVEENLMTAERKKPRKGETTSST